MFDSYGDGICCDYGEGDFFMLDADFNIIFENNGVFENFTQEVFCLDEDGCEITAEIDITNTSSEGSEDGAISITVISGVSPYQYSIDGGETYTESNNFTGLSAGEYNISIFGSAGSCMLEQTITIDFCSFTSVDIEATGVASNLSAEGTISITPNSGVAPYQYSIDGGQNFYENSFFSDLPTGLYNIVVYDSQNTCSFNETVEVEIESVIINEINYRSDDDFNPNDWIELYNPKPYSIDLSGWQIRDDNNNHVFYIPESTQIDAEGFLVIVRDEYDFNISYPGIPFIGELGFGLGGSDAVRLFNSQSRLIDEVYYEVVNDPSCEHTFNMIDSYGDGWNGNFVSVVVNGEVALNQITFTDGYFDSATFDASQGDIIELIWFDGNWSEEVSFEILDGAGNIISSGHYGDTLLVQNVLAYCYDFSSNWPLCADGTGNTLELINPGFDNLLYENWDCINDFGSPNAPNSENLSSSIILHYDSVKIYPNPVNNMLFISGGSEKYNIEIYTLTGQKLYQDFNVSTIDMSLYENGIYIIKIYDQNSISTKREIKLN